MGPVLKAENCPFEVHEEYKRQPSIPESIDITTENQSLESKLLVLPNNIQ